MAARDKSYLERHGEQWRVIVKVPVVLRPVIGKANLKQALGTSDLARANLLKWPWVERFKRTIAAARSGTSTDQPPGEAWQGEARTIRNVRRQRPRQVEEVFDPISGDTIVGQTDPTAEWIEERAEQIEQTEGAAAAQSFVAAATGEATPITEHLDAFIADPDTAYVPKSVLDLRRAVDRLSAWLRTNGRPVTLQAVTRAAAQEFLRWHRSQMSKKSHGKYRAFLTSYWDWMAEQEHVPIGAELWEVRTSRRRKASRPSAATLADDGGKRPFTSAELVKLLTGKPTRPYMADLIRIAALSGMRIEEIYALRVRDCADSVFNIRAGKTANAARHVPIHSALQPIVARLTKGKAASAYLIDPAAPLIDKTGLRSGAATKAFTRYRRACGVDERPNDKAKSNVDFHSFRRWFVTEAEAALGRGATGYTPMTLADVVGHGHDATALGKALPMTMGVYRGKADDAARRACVEAVKLPEGRSREA